MNMDKISVEPRSNEVASVKYVTQQQLRDLMNSKDVKITPWFKIVADKFLFTWWDALTKGQLEKHQDHKTIHSMV
jgi:isopentenyl-diphosphate delta-isomerase